MIKFNTQTVINLKINNKKAILTTVVLTLIIRTIISHILPQVGTDGPWALSPVFSYIIGEPDYSLLAHEFMQDAFSANLTDYLISRWFVYFNLSTYSFIWLHIVLISATLIIWHHFSSYNANAVYLLMFSFAFSPYTFGFRPENYTILFLSLEILALSIVTNQIYKITLALVFGITAGLFHHIGGVFALVVLAIYWWNERPRLSITFLTLIVGLILTMLLSNGEIIEYIKMPLLAKSEVDNHFNNPKLNLGAKYAVFGSPIIFLILLLQVRNSVINSIIYAVVLTLLVFAGRSYYWPYLHIVALSIIVLTRVEKNKTSELAIFPPLGSKFRYAITTGILYSSAAYLLIPFVLTLSSYNTSAKWREILTRIDIDERAWKASEYKYFLPSQLCLEVADNKLARLLYPFMHLNDGIQSTQDKVFYVYTKKQLEWIKKNFDTTSRSQVIEKIVEPEEGEIRISSLYRFKVVRNDSIGLWRVSYIEQDSFRTDQ